MCARNVFSSFDIWVTADSVMARISSYVDWLDEECGNMAREGIPFTLVSLLRDITLVYNSAGLRTLVFAYKRISEHTYQEWLQR